MRKGRAIAQEALMQTGQFARIQPQDFTLHDLMQAYSEKVTPTKKGVAQEFRRISQLMKERDLMLTPYPQLNRTSLPTFVTGALRMAFRLANKIWFFFVTRGT
jgi:hypothetical protein